MSADTKTASVEMAVTKQCGGSVRFDAPKPEAGQAPAVLNNAYVNRSFPAINAAKRIRVTVEVLE